MQLATKLATKSRQYFEKVSFKPAIQSGLTQMNYADAPNHPDQRYRLTDLGKDPATVSKWCTNASQPSLEVTIRIATLLNVEMNALVHLEEITR